MSEQPTTGNRVTLPRWLSVVLILSVTVNVFLAGFILSGMVRHHFFDRRGPDMMAGPVSGFDVIREPRRLARLLSEEGREIVIAKIREVGPGIREKMRERRDAQAVIAEAVAADPFNPEALDAAFAEAESIDLSIMRAGRAAMAEVIAALPPEDRGKIARIMRHHGRPGGHHAGPPLGSAPADE